LSGHSPREGRHVVQRQEDTMFHSFLKIRNVLAAAAVVAAGTLLAGPVCQAADDDVRLVRT
jgi:hypothetical protein